MASNSILSSHDLHTYYHDAKKYQPSHRRAETAPASSSLTRPAGPLVSSRDAALQKRKLHDERTAGESHLPEPGLRPEHQTPPPRAPLPAAQHSPPKRPELSIGPGKRPGSPAPNISQLSKPTYFFHCLNQRLSTRYLQHTAPAGAAPLSGGPARPAPTGPAARRGKGTEGGRAGRLHSPGLPRPEGRGQQRPQLGPLRRRVRPHPAAFSRRHVAARAPSRADVGPRAHARWVSLLRSPRPAPPARPLTGWAGPRAGGGWRREGYGGGRHLAIAAHGSAVGRPSAPECGPLVGAAPGAAGAGRVSAAPLPGRLAPAGQRAGRAGSCEGAGRPRPRGGWASSPRWLRGREGLTERPPPKHVAEVFAADSVVSALRAPFSVATDFTEASGQSVG